MHSAGVRAIWKSPTRRQHRSSAAARTKNSLPRVRSAKITRPEPQVAKARKIVLPNIGKLSGARTGLLPVFLEPSLASPCEKPPTGPKWIHEIKYDGYRMQARIDGRTIRLLTRKKLDWTERFRSIADALKALGLGSALIDGEIVVEDASGISNFNNLQADLKAGRLDRFRYFVFDILYCEGFDLTKVVLKDRKELLHQLLAGLPAGSPIRFSEHLDVDGPTMLEHSCRLGLEGIISKRVGPAISIWPRRPLAQEQMRRATGVRHPGLRSLDGQQPVRRIASARLS